MISSGLDLLSGLANGFNWQVEVDGSVFHVETNKPNKTDAKVEAYKAAFSGIGLSKETIQTRLSNCQMEITKGPVPLDRIAICSANANI